MSDQKVVLLRNDALRVKNLVVSYGKKTVLQVPELYIPATGVTVFAGSSGSGKSSLLSVLANLGNDQLKYTGEIYDTENARNASSELQYSMVWQTPTVFPCSIWDNLVIPLRKRKIPKEERKALMLEALDKVGLLSELGKNWDKVRADQISGGQKQRLCLAISVLQDSKLIFLDEPCSALDPHSCEKVEKIIRELSKTRALVLVTHNLGQARRLASHVAIFCAENGVGVVCETGPANILHSPLSNPAKQFLQSEVG